MANNPLLGSFGDISGSSLMFRNKIINGGFDIWQRNTTNTVTSVSAYVSADRWFVSSGGGGTATFSRQNSGATEGAFFGSKYYYRHNQTVANASNGRLYHHVESVWTLSNETATLTFWMKANKALTTLVTINQNFGSGGTPSSTVTVLDTSITLSTTWTKYTFTVNMPSVAGKVLGTDNNDKVEIWCRFPPSDTYIVDAAEFQFEAGPVATPFEYRPLGTELALCQRYYWTPFFNSTATDFPRIRSSLNSGNTVQFNIVTPVTMKKSPSIVGTANTDYRIFAAAGGGGLTINSASIVGYGGNNISMEIVATTAPGDAVLALKQVTSGTISQFGLDAEI